MGDDVYSMRRYSDLVEILKDDKLTSEKLMAFGGNLRAGWNRDYDKDRSIEPSDDIVVLTRNIPEIPCHSIVFHKDKDGYYKADVKSNL